MSAHTCMWCPTVCPTARAHMDHVGTVHADRLFQGRAVTRRTWSCWACARDNDPSVATCTSCGHVNGSSNPHRILT